MIVLPEAFKKRMQTQRRDAQELFDALDTTAPTSIRINPNKPVKHFLDKADVPWCETGFYLEQRPSFTLDPLFHAGAYYPQEAGSMFIDAVLKKIQVPDDAVVLDLCAAPGGKSTILLDNLSDNALLVSNEIMRNRAYILRDSLTKWGNSNVMVTNKSAQDFSQCHGLFDLVLVDAPCSGEGMFRKDLKARNEWTENNTHICAVRQTDILNTIWPTIKEDGYLLYSTCTFNPAENDQQLLQLLGNLDAEIVSLDFPNTWGLESDSVGYSCLPHLMKTEGFFFVLIQKTEATPNYKIRKNNTKNRKVVEKNDVFPFTLDPKYRPVYLKDAFYQIPESQSEMMLHLNEILGCMKMGTRLGEVINRKFNPHFEWALAKEEPKEFNAYELSLKDALQFLKGNAIDVLAKDGWNLATFQGTGLGWFKKIGNRINNYYPKELRIRMEL